MAEIANFTLQIDSGDLIGIVAIILSVITFWFAYSSNKKNEQLRSANMIIEDIDKNYMTLKNIDNRWRELEISDSHKKEPPRVRSDEYRKLEDEAKIIIGKMKSRFDYYSFLIENRSIDNKKIIAYHDSKLMDIYFDVGRKICQDMDIED